MAYIPLDSLGWAYIGLGITWTVVLIAGMLFLYQQRHLPCLQIRRLPLLFAGIASLHIYGMISLTAYVILPRAPCTVEFWIMSIYLPFGIAMFHAANSQFLHIASRQKQFARMSALSEPSPVDEKQAERLASSRFQRILRGVERADKIDRMMLWIGIGLAVQVVLTLIIYFGSEKFHPSYGFFGYVVTGTEAEIKSRCVRGWEWWLSIVWQFFWAWIYAPYMLWKSRGIRDVHGWRTQTICCCLAGLPASPLWLAGLYAPGMASLNTYFLPPMWFSVSIFFMEVFTIIFPIVQVLKSQHLRQGTLEALEAWEKRQELQGNSDSTIAGSEVGSNKDSTYTSATYTAESENAPIKICFDAESTVTLNMTALEFLLRTNPEPLLQFAALKDFSGENVSFLTHVAEWKRAWFVPLGSTQEQRRQQFIAAVRIYTNFVSLDCAEFPINISSQEMKCLQEVFSHAAAILMRRPSSGSTDTITPFDMENDSSSTVDFKTGINLDTLGRNNLKSVQRMTELGTAEREAVTDISIPDMFTPDIFQSAEQEIKYLVFTNTWPKFVITNRMSSLTEVEDEEAGRSWTSKVLCN